MSTSKEIYDFYRNQTLVECLETLQSHNEFLKNDNDRDSMEVVKQRNVVLKLAIRDHMSNENIQHDDSSLPLVINHLDGNINNLLADKAILLSKIHELQREYDSLNQLISKKKLDKLNYEVLKEIPDRKRRTKLFC